MQRLILLAAFSTVAVPAVAEAKDPGLVRAAWKVSNAYTSAKYRLRNFKRSVGYKAGDQLSKLKGVAGLQVARLALAVKRVPKAFRKHVLAELRKGVHTKAIMGIWPTVEVGKKRVRFAVKWNDEGILETRAVAIDRKGKSPVTFSVDTRPVNDQGSFSGEIRRLRRLDSGGYVETLFGTDNPRLANGQPESLYFLHRAGARKPISEAEATSLK